MHPVVEVLAIDQGWTVCIRDWIGDHSMHLKGTESAEAYAMAERTRLVLSDNASPPAHSGEGFLEQGERRA